MGRVSYSGSNEKALLAGWRIPFTTRSSHLLDPNRPMRSAGYNPLNLSEGGGEYELRDRRNGAGGKKMDYLGRLLGGRETQSRLYKFLFALFVLIVARVLLFFYQYELHVELQAFNRGWVREAIVELQPLSSTCFDSAVINASLYNTTLASSPNFVDVHSGIAMPFGRDCFDFAASLPQHPLPGMIIPTHTILHTYWRADLRPLGKRQISLLHSILATQDRATTSVILWTNSPSTTYLSQDPLLAPLLSLYGDRLTLASVDKKVLAVGTPMEDHPLLEAKDDLAWLDGDIVRVLVLWAKGGLWVDFDTIMTGRDVRVLTESEWVTQWDCYDKIYIPLNGAMMHFHQHSPYLCEMLYGMANDPAPRESTTDWGSLLYHKIFRRLISNQITPFKILPYCFTDGRNCQLNNRLPDVFAAPDSSWGAGRMEDLERKLDGVWAVHLHNQWDKDFPTGGWVRELIISTVSKKVREYREGENLIMDK